MFEARAWIAQAMSDARTASALLALPEPMNDDDRGCHVAALSAQTVEKSIKAYVILNGARPGMTHRADKYLSSLLAGGGLLRHAEHRAALSALFDPPTRGVVRQLLDLTPGTTAHKDPPNTEYPWGQGFDATSPAGSPELSSVDDAKLWASAAMRVVTGVRKLIIAADRFG